MSKDIDLKHFHTLITRLNSGGLADEIDEKMAECIQEIADACTDRAGTHKAKITVSLEFQMNHKDKVVEVYPEVTTKLPKAPKGRGGLYYCNEDGHLVRENPRQLTLDDELERKRLRDAERAGQTG